MTQDTEATMILYMEALEREHIPCQDLFIFGSVARGEEHEWSDIDVAVVGPAFGADRIEEMVQLRVVAQKIDPAISPVPLRPEDLEDRFSTIGQVVQREGKRIN